MNAPDSNAITSVLALLQAGRRAEAAQRCRELIAAHPGLAPAHHLLGVLAGEAGDFKAAAGHFAQAVAADPHDLASINALGNLHWAQGRMSEAAACYQRVLAQQPGNVAALLNLGNALARLGQAAGAVGCFEQALTLQADSADARFGLANALAGMGRYERAVSLYQEVARAQPDFPGLQVNLGLALMKLGRCQDAIDRYDHAIARNPADYMAHNNRGNALVAQHRTSEALASFRQALAIKPDHVNAHSNLLLSMNYTETDQAVIYAEALRFDARHAAPLRPAQPAWANSREPGRVLRVGYVSADFRGHSVAFFLQSVLATHHRTQVHVTCYANVDGPDAVTARLQRLADQWRSIIGVPDAEVARQVSADGIDILVDLGGHTGGNRLLVFARQPAPVQVSWLGYPNTTGLRAIGYRLTDAVADPVGEADALHTEKLVRLPEGFLCYQSDAAPPAMQAMAGRLQAGVTFASFNTLAKVTPEVVRVWAEILQRTPRSRLLLKSDSLGDAFARARIVAAFGQHGVPAARLELLAWVPDYAQHMALYDGVDLALDPFPYNGATTTCEALWMGVPVLTLRGNRHAARVGASLLHHAGLPEWIAASEADYIARAVACAADRPALAAARAVVGARMRSSALTDPARFTAALERAYREMWVNWCEGHHLTTP